MARFIDESPEYQPEDGEALANFDDEEQIPEEEQPVEPEEIQEAQEDPIPEKYQGKDIKDIVRMHQEAEKLLGKQSSEVGELRGIVDTFVKTQLEKANSPQQQEDVDDDIDFFDDPKKAVEAAIAKHPKIKEAEQLSSYMKQQAALNKLHSDHPDFNDIIQDNNFQEWVMASQVRQELYQRADQNFDYASANELLSTWKERQNIVKESAEMHEADRKRQLKSASTGNAKGSGEKPSRKVYRRADIIKLMQTDPDRYQQLAPEIRVAYAEGRVK
jgi:predicted RNA-binding Zn ribbon-like protein